MKVIAIDPGNEESAYVIWDGVSIIEKNIQENDVLLKYLGFFDGRDTKPDILVIEQVRSYGMAVGMTVFDTVFWSGRLYERWSGPAEMIPRLEVKQHICHDSRAKDSNIRRALIDRFEPELQLRQRPKGVLKGVVSHEWAAFALAVTFYDKQKKPGV